MAAAKLDEYWSHLRMTDPDLIGHSLLKPGYGSFTRNTQLDDSMNSEQHTSLSEALETYLTQKGASKPKTFKAAAQRACSYLVDACGAKTLAEYTRVDALSYRDYLIAEELVNTSSSKRLIPLVGASLEAVKVMHRQCDNSFLFKSYASEDGCNGNSCSATLNKWLKQHVSNAVIHSFRHSFRDRLRNVGVQSEMIDQLGGWSRQSVAQGYGKGYDLPKIHEAIQSIIQYFRE